MNPNENACKKLWRDEGRKPRLDMKPKEYKKLLRGTRRKFRY